MIESAAANVGAGVVQTLIGRVGQSLGPSAGEVPADLDQAISNLELPGPLLERLSPPLTQLGFSIDASTVQVVGLPAPPSYTVAARDSVRLGLLNLPDFLFSATNATVMIVTGLGFSFGRGSRLHLFARERDALPDFMETAMKSWAKGGVDARFHPWLRTSELEQSANAVDFVTRLFELEELPAAGGNGGARAPQTELDQNQWRLLHAGLLKAFPSYKALELLAITRFPKPLPAISSEVAMIFVVLDVINAAAAEGWLPDLVSGARAENPRNPELQAAALAIPPELGGERP